LKLANHRSKRLLDRLGFRVATIREIAHEEVATDELLMVRAAARNSKGARAQKGSEVC
jgi:hypothetical protein